MHSAEQLRWQKNPPSFHLPSDVFVDVLARLRRDRSNRHPVRALLLGVQSRRPHRVQQLLALRKRYNSLSPAHQVYSSLLCSELCHFWLSHYLDNLGSNHLSWLGYCEPRWQDYNSCPYAESWSLLHACSVASLKQAPKLYSTSPN